ncbi:MAG TPA: hypothetical protein VK184_21805 [Nostocaceae cyanobacterium]|nr:hypothetical protein [Nostocaceae cyanobacterium]
MTTSLLSKSQITGNEIRIIGSRKSGKTTYLASLLRFPKELKNKFPELEIIPLTNHAEQLIEMAKNILEQGAIFAGTDIGDEPFYSFQIKIPASKKSPGITLELSVKDYNGEAFEKAAQLHRLPEFQIYLDDWCTAPSWMIMLTDWEARNDQRIYAPAIKKLLQEVSERAAIQPALNNLRVAVVMTKCERGELWPCRFDPEEDLFKVRLQNTYRVLKENLPPSRLGFFACSAFGVLSDRPMDFDPRPNRYVPGDGSSAEFNTYLRDVSAWKPFGLISPLYWLSTGRLYHDECL